MEPSLMISGISSIVACIALMVSISSNKKANKAERSKEVVDLRIEALQLQTTIEFFHKRYIEKLERHPEEITQEIDISPVGLIETIKEIEEALAKGGFKDRDEIDQLKVLLGKIKKQWQYIEKDYL